MNKLFVLMGASGAGKSTLLDRVVQDGCCNTVAKYSERKKFNSIDDIYTVKNIKDPNLRCDLIYSMYGNLYGFNSEDIKEQLQKKNIIIITNDKRTIKRLKEIFSKQVIVIYIVSDINQRLLGRIYMKRHGVPTMKNIESQIIEELKHCKETILKDDGENFIQDIERINDIIDNILLEDKEFRLRLESVKQQEKLYLSTYDYIVLNLYSNKVSTIHATESAFEQLRMIINKEGNGKNE